MKKFLNGIKKAFKLLGRAISLVFVTVYRTLVWLLDNTIGFFFTKKYTPFNNKGETHPLWKKIRTALLIIILLVIIFSFRFLYEHSLGILIGSTLKLIGSFFPSNNAYGKILSNYGNRLATGIGTTIYLSLIGTTIGFILAMLLSLIVTLEINPTDKKITVFFKKVGINFVKLYVTIVRGTPMMVQAMILYWGVHSFLKWDFLIAGLATVSINTTAYLTEVLRGGIESIDKGQTEGALALGLNPFQTMISVIFPQAIKNSMASIGNEFVINIKDTSVLSVIMVVDLFRVAVEIQGVYLDPFPPFIIVAVIYLILTTSVTAILNSLSKKLDVPVVHLPSSN